MSKAQTPAAKPEDTKDKWAEPAKRIIKQLNEDTNQELIAALRAYENGAPPKKLTPETLDDVRKQVGHYLSNTYGDFSRNDQDVRAELELLLNLLEQQADKHTKHQDYATSGLALRVRPYFQNQENEQTVTDRLNLLNTSKHLEFFNTHKDKALHSLTQEKVHKLNNAKLILKNALDATDIIRDPQYRSTIQEAHTALKEKFDASKKAQKPMLAVMKQIYAGYQATGSKGWGFFKGKNAAWPQIKKANSLNKLITILKKRAEKSPNGASAHTLAAIDKMIAEEAPFSGKHSISDAAKAALREHYPAPNEYPKKARKLRGNAWSKKLELSGMLKENTEKPQGPATFNPP